MDSLYKSSQFISNTELAIEAAEAALGLVPSSERVDAEKLLKLCREHWLSSSQGMPYTTKEVAHLVEILARRSSAAIPFATLGRALLASMVGESKHSAQLLNEFHGTLAQLGL